MHGRFCWPPSCTFPPLRGESFAELLCWTLFLGDKCKLTLVSAPAGWGKTTLVAQWVAEAADTGGLQFGWLTFDGSDNDRCGSGCMRSPRFKRPARASVLAL